MIGPGIYAKEADDLLAKCEAKIVLLVVIGGNKGSQCEFAGDVEDMTKLAGTLRKLAEDIEEQHRMLPHAE